MVTRYRVGKGEMEQGGQKIQTSGYKMNEYLGYNVQHSTYS